MDDLLAGWGMLNRNAWLPPALLCVCFLFLAVTLTLRVRARLCALYALVAAAGLVVLGAGQALTGVVVGDAPVVQPTLLIPMIRLINLCAGVLLAGYLTVYWVRGGR